MDIELDKVYNMDCLSGLRQMPDNSVDCCITSPPYYALRDYGCEGQIGLEDTPQAYIDRLTEVFMEVYRVMKPTGTLWVNIGDSYNGNKKGNTEANKNKRVAESNHFEKKLLDGAKQKDLIGIPWMLAFSLRNEGWYLRQDIIWSKPNAMPESVKDRCVKSHEYIFLLSKSQKYYFDYEQIQEKAVTCENCPTGIERNRLFDYDSKQNNHPEAYLINRTQKQGYAKAGGHRDQSGGYPMRTKNCQYDGQTPNSMHLRRENGLPDNQYYVRNKRDVWSVNTKPDLNAHFAVYPEELIRPCVLAGCPVGGVILDPFMGSGTTARCARRWGRHYIGFELNQEYIKIINEKTNVETDMFAY